MKSRKILNLSGILFYKFLLDIAYITYTNKNYEYMGFTKDIDFIKVIESYLFIIVIFVMLKQNKIKISHIFLNVIHILTIIPLFTVYCIKGESRTYAYAILGSFVLTVMLVNILPDIKMNIKFNFNKLVFVLILINTVIVYTGLIYFNGLPSMNVLDFNNTYIYRSEVKYGFEFMKYLVTWQGGVINVFIIMNSLYEQNYKKFILFSVLQILLFMLTTHKTFLFYPILLLVLKKIINSRKINFYTTAIYGTLMTVVGAMGIYLLDISKMAPSLIINRTLLLPAQISFQYYEFFSTNGLVKLSHSILSPFFKQPIYNIDPVRLIGQVYYNNNWPNTGYLGDAYMNFGILGMFGFSVCLAILLKFIECFSNSEYKRKLASAYIILYAVTISNVGLLTSLLNNGMLIFIMLILMYKTNRTYKIKKKKGFKCF